MKRVEVHIERLVLRGVGTTAPAAVAQALQAELQRLLGTGEALAALERAGHLPHLPVPGLRAGPGAAPADLGRQAAQRIGAGLAQQAGRSHRG